MLCFGYKVLGEKRTHCLNAWDYPTWNKSVNDDYHLVKAAYEILIGADVIVTHNGKRFDEKFLNTRLAYHNLPPLPKLVHIDTCMVAQKRLYLAGNRLNDLAKFFRLPIEKMKHDGWDLWVDVWYRKPKAMKIMAAYCKQDVNVLEQCFNKLHANYSDQLPNFNHWRKGREEVCPACGSDEYIKWGYNRKPLIPQPRYKCKTCRATFQGNAKGERLRNSQ